MPVSPGRMPRLYGSQDGCRYQQLGDAPGEQCHGCIKLGMPGRGQLVPGTTASGFWGQAVPAPFTRAFGSELDAALEQCLQITARSATGRDKSVRSATPEPDR